MPPDAQSFRKSFLERAQLGELMDEPASYEQFRGCLRDLERVNRAVLAYRPTLRWLSRFSSPEAPATAASPLHILDVGSGGGDMLRRIERWARARNLPVQLTGLDLNPHAARAARESTPAASRIEWITGDVFAYIPRRRVDLIISSIFTHHLTDADIVRFLEWMEQTAARGWFINDLWRSRRSWHLFRALAHLMRWHPFVLHDGPVSIRRSFRPEDWRRYLAAAGLSDDKAQIFPAWPGRLCVARVKS
ncbi:MAG TPA: methyltransferase domain-containing protein [Terracidiphilus sp.]|jgi:SAM-dependent methyltransferase|nr:methyltransferase domain-containing protein [Terracidiphilus sp.]